MCVAEQFNVMAVAAAIATKRTVAIVGNSGRAGCNCPHEGEKSKMTFCVKQVQNLLLFNSIMASGSLPSNDQQKKTTITVAVGGSGTPIQLVGFSNWNNLKDKNNTKSVTCDFCLKTSMGGITRAKRHQLGIRGYVGACRKIPEDIRLELKAAFEQKQK
ncbi:hypothetical protein CR513_59679, partial [Mucuna pruriens]